MKYTIVFTKTAIETSEAITTQLQNRWGDKIVDNFERRSIEVLHLLEDSPLVFPVSKFDKNLRKGFIHKNCSVYYEVKSNCYPFLLGQSPGTIILTSHVNTKKPLLFKERPDSIYLRL